MPPEPKDLLQAALAAFQQRFPNDGQAEKIRRFVDRRPDALSRACAEGHVTSSAWVFDPDRRSVALVFHPKLHRWLQPGGHLDPGESTLEGSLREAREETGLRSLRHAGSEVFDVDVHVIPARKDEPEHLHYDVRHLILGDARETPHPQEEIRSVRWVSVEAVRELTEEWSVLRMVDRVLLPE